MVQEHQIVVVIHISFAQSCKIFAWSCKIFAWSCKLGQRIIFHIFKAMKTPLFFGMIPLFLHERAKWWWTIKTPFSLLHAFHPSGKSFKTQIKELRWIYLMDTKKNQNQKIKIQMKLKNWEIIGLASHWHD